jgi:hypothetical protein
MLAVLAHCERSFRRGRNRWAALPARMRDAVPAVLQHAVVSVVASAVLLFRTRAALVHIP